jgi:outer membrane protein assembly factor BamE (lipoprotein component of BamABCDE complex)
MRKLFIFIIISLFISGCTLNRVEKRHGIYNLEKKSKKLQLLKSNTNDAITKIGIPSTKSTFDKDTWYYLERNITSSELTSLGKEKLLINDVLVLKFNDKGLLVEKKFVSINDMNDLNISPDKTNVLNKKDNFFNILISSLKKKINDPLGIKKAK